MEGTKRGESSAPLLHWEIIPSNFRETDARRYRSYGRFRDQRLNGVGSVAISSTRGRTWIVLSLFGLRGASMIATKVMNAMTHIANVMYFM